MKPPLRIACAQFPVSGGLARNAGYIAKQMQPAAAERAQLIRFPETALCGYGPSHLDTIENYPWQELDSQMKAICELAASLDLWVVVGSMRQVPGEFPRNCLQVISSSGALAGAYEKQRLYGREREFYIQGTAPLVLEIHGYRCGFLICYDHCFPELYETYRDLGVELLFHSFYNAENRAATSIADLMHANLIVRAADNQMWIAASNSSARYSPLPACIVRPDGSMLRAKRHATGIVVDDFPLAELGWTYDNRSI
jgi:predicted amidohydrolase